MKQKPNVIFILTDQQRYDSLGCNGNPHAVTPHLDQLAKDGTLCSRYITANAICMPSRASLITGLHPSGHQVASNGFPLARVNHRPSQGGECEDPASLEKWFHTPTLAEIFKDAGYHTQSVGKLHFTATSADAAFGYEESCQKWEQEDIRDWHGPYFGFQHVDLSLGHGENSKQGHYATWVKDNFPDLDRTIPPESKHPILGDLHPGFLPEEAHHSTWCGNLACEFIESHARNEAPFFLWVGFPDPHHPFTPPASLASEFESHEYQEPLTTQADLADKPTPYRDEKCQSHFTKCPQDAIPRVRQYTDAMVHLIDKNVGRMIETLKKTNQWDNTIIVYTSDHGDFLGDFGLIRKSQFACNALNHVPFIIRAPQSTLPSQIDRPLSGVDVLPTLCDLADIELTHNRHGQSILSKLESTEIEPALIQHTTPLSPELINFSLYDEHYRLTWYPHFNETELYDHRTDPQEAKNLANDPEHRTRCDHMLDTLKTQTLKTMAPYYGKIANW